jgi:hypothetical protein
MSLYFNSSWFTTFRSLGCEANITTIDLKQCTNVPAFIPGEDSWPGGVAKSVGHGINGFGGYSEPDCKGEYYCCNIENACRALVEPETIVGSIQFVGTSTARVLPTEDCKEPIESIQQVTQIHGVIYMKHNEGSKAFGDKLVKIA